MSERIRRMYIEAGLTPPKGKGIHTVAAHKCVINYLKKGLSKSEAWKRCAGALREKAIRPEHRRKTRY